ncbi:hypothetical protein MY4038_000203 [Beauveria bassiana]
MTIAPIHGLSARSFGQVAQDAENRGNKSDYPAYPGVSLLAKKHVREHSQLHNNHDPAPTWSAT